MKNKLVIATHNKGKVKEIRELLDDLTWELVSLADYFDVGEAEETESSYAGNAIAKARYYARATSEWVLADDSGLEVDALDGRPGVLSARYAGGNASDADRRARLLLELGTLNASQRSARFVCAAALANPDQDLVKLSEGICEGVIAIAERGNSGFGYDPIFIPNGYHLTFGELSQDIKNRISHRAKAMIAMREFLDEGSVA